jgi:hypothetical protein
MNIQPQVKRTNMTWQSCNDCRIYPSGSGRYPAGPLSPVKGAKAAGSAGPVLRNVKRSYQTDTWGNFHITGTSNQR